MAKKTTYTNRSQCDLLLEHLRTNDHITQIQAITLYRVFNLKGRICDLRDRGWNINTVMCEDATGKSYARYSLDPTDVELLNALPPEERDSMVMMRGLATLREARKVAH